MLYVDEQSKSFGTQSGSIIAVKGGRVEHLNTRPHFIVMTGAHRFQNC